jgi:hypothetical protein
MATETIPTNTVAAPTGLITKMFHWVFHPYYADTDPWDWAAFVLLLFMLGYLWSKVVRQTLDAVI